MIRTVRTGSEADASRVGSVLGTPPYMAPEQASGDVDAIDERADVFGLGSILCELFTGKPAYTGPTSEAVLRRAIRGDTTEALRRLEACGADAELIRLAEDCLAVERDERPREAGELARRLTSYLAGVQERLRAVELARAAEDSPFAVKLEPYREVIEDRARVLQCGQSRVIVVADGAAGVSYGAEAAEAVVRRVEEFVSRGPDFEDPQTWSDFLTETDLALGLANDCGITTAVVLAVTPASLCGASVGDSQAWLVTHDDHRVLTLHQRKKPLVGDGCAEPVSFCLARKQGVLLVATDGLFKYTNSASICRTVSELTPDLACQKLIDLARLPNGALQDDVGVVVCRL